jgi:hypothetical protein
MSKQHLRLITPCSSDAGQDGTTPFASRPERLADLILDAVQTAAPLPSPGGALTLHLESVPLQPSDPALSLDVACRGGSVVDFDAVTLRIRSRRMNTARALKVAEHALDEYGGTRFVGLTATAGPGRSGAGLDATVCFPHRVAFVAHNVVSVPHVMLVEQVDVYSEILRSLGVAHRAVHSTFKVPRVQMRSMPSKAQLVESFAVTIGSGLTAALYAAELPLRHSMRVEYRSGRDGHLDLALSRGRSNGQSCSVLDCDELQNFIERHFEARVSELEWQVTTRLWGGEQNAPARHLKDVSR